jgi:hypothetical protein
MGSLVRIFIISIFVSLRNCRWSGEAASFLLEAIYVRIVLFIPFGIVGTWRPKAFERERGWQRLQKLLGWDEVSGK